MYSPITSNNTAVHNHMKPYSGTSKMPTNRQNIKLDALDANDVTRVKRILIRCTSMHVASDSAEEVYHTSRPFPFKPLHVHERRTVAILSLV